MLPTREEEEEEYKSLQKSELTHLWSVVRHISQNSLLSIVTTCPRRLGQVAHSQKLPSLNDARRLDAAVAVDLAHPVVACDLAGVAQTAGQRHRAHSSV